MNEIFEKIKILFNKIINKEELLPEDSKTVEVEIINTSGLNSNIKTSSNDTVNIMNQQQTGVFMENTYEIDKLKSRIESGEELIDNISYEKKLELIRSYEKENEMLKTEIRAILRNSNNNN